MEQLPPVAKSFSHHCSKCEGEKYHRVLAHPTPKSAKIECEICGKKSTFKLSSPKKPRVAGAKKAAVSATKKRDEWLNLVQQNDGSNARTYSIREKFKANEKIEHVKFGVGFIMGVAGDRVTVLFEDGEKTLIHGH